MMELLRQWLTGVTCAAMIAALADSLTPAGTGKKIGRMAGGLLLLIALVQPVLEVDFSALASASVPLELEESELEKTDLEWMKTIIGRETGAYILDKAEELGIPCQGVAVTCAVTEDGVPYPSAVAVSGPLTQAEREELSRAIETDLAIPADRQTYESEDEEP